MPKFGEEVDVKRAKVGAPPVIIALQPTHYFEISKPEEIKQWEKLVGRSQKEFVGILSESCTGGCSDDCDNG
ncbi:MAG: hypothetical protein ACHQPI_00425 [Thermoanaerobaculia bacterium]